MVIEVKVPSPGESITEVILDSWLKKDGDFVQRDEALAEIQSDKAMLTLYAEAAGVLKTLAQPGDTLAVGATVARIDTAATTGAAPAASPEAKPEAKPEAQPAAVATPAVAAPAPSQLGYAQGLPSPAAERALAERGLAANQVPGTGPGGRITKADVLTAKTPAAPPSAPASNGSAAPVAAAPVAFSRDLKREKMSALRKTLAKRLVSVKNETAMLTTFNEVDMTAILETRRKYKDILEKKTGIRLGFMGFFAKAVVQALQEWPAVNASIDGEEIVYHNFVDLGVAVSTDRGLMVPVIRNAESKSLVQIEAEIGDLAKRARDNKITIPEMTGGTYTLTNGGVFGSLMSTPILNPPQSAILGMHKVEERPVVVEGQIVIRPMMYLAMSYDHRIIDGRESVSFLVRVKENLEDPIRLLLGA